MLKFKKHFAGRYIATLGTAVIVVEKLEGEWTSYLEGDMTRDTQEFYHTKKQAIETVNCYASNPDNVKEWQEYLTEEEVKVFQI